MSDNNPEPTNTDTTTEKTEQQGEGAAATASADTPTVSPGASPILAPAASTAAQVPTPTTTTSLRLPIRFTGDLAADLQKDDEFSSRNYVIACSLKEPGQQRTAHNGSGASLTQLQGSITSSSGKVGKDSGANGSRTSPIPPHQRTASDEGYIGNGCNPAGGARGEKDRLVQVDGVVDANGTPTGNSSFNNHSVTNSSYAHAEEDQFRVLVLPRITSSAAIVTSPTKNSSASPVASKTGGIGTNISSPTSSQPNTNSIPVATSAFTQALQGNCASPTRGRVRLREIRVFCNFAPFPVGAGPNVKRVSYTVRMRDGARGVDVVDSTIRIFMNADAKLQNKLSWDPWDYRLFLADDYTGEEETKIALDSPFGNFTHLAIVAQDQAYLSEYPQHSTLLPTTVEDIPLAVEIVEPNASPSKNDSASLSARPSLSSSQKISTNRNVFVPADIIVDSLPGVITQKLGLTDVSESSLRIKYGPSLVEPSQRFNFGGGCGKSDVPVRARTLLSLYRFGVREVCLQGCLKDKNNGEDKDGSGASRIPSQSIALFKKLDEEEARAYQQFEVNKINKYGVSQARIIGVDGERIYNMKPSGEMGKTKNPERNIADIEVIRTFDDPTYFEVEYKKTCRYDTDRFDCRNQLVCAILLEKLRVLKKLHDRQQQEVLRRADSKLSKFTSLISSKLRSGK